MPKSRLVDSKIPCDKKGSMLREEMEENILSESEETEIISFYVLAPHKSKNGVD